jgi:hypothetical protein
MNVPVDDRGRRRAGPGAAGQRPAGEAATTR